MPARRGAPPDRYALRAVPGPEGSAEAPGRDRWIRARDDAGLDIRYPESTFSVEMKSKRRLNDSGFGRATIRRRMLMGLNRVDWWASKAAKVGPAGAGGAARKHFVSRDDGTNDSAVTGGFRRFQTTLFNAERGPGAS